MLYECPVCFDEKDYDDDILHSMCGHHICKDCYEMLLKKKCPICRRNYEDLNERWFKVCVEAKYYVLQGEKSLSWKLFKSLKGEEDTVESENDYSDWKYEYLHQTVDEYVTDIMDKERLNEFLSSYGFGLALSDYTDEYGYDSLPLPFELKIEKCLVYHKIYSFLREFL